MSCGDVIAMDGNVKGRFPIVKRPASDLESNSLEAIYNERKSRSLLHIAA